MGAIKASPAAMGSLEAMLHGLASDVGKLSPQSQTAIHAAIVAVATYDAKPFLNGLIVSVAGKLGGGFLGGKVVAPGIERSADALADQLVTDATTPQ